MAKRIAKHLAKYQNKFSNINDVSTTAFERLVELEYLGLVESEVKGIINPFDLRTIREIEEPHFHLLRMMKNPDYFNFTCRWLLNFDLAPYQTATVATLWEHPFPLLIGSRGFGKCENGKTWVISESGFKRLEEVAGGLPPMTRKYVEGVSLLGENGFNEVEYGWNNGVSSTKKIRTSCGYEVEATLNHPIRVVRNGGIEWVEAADVRVEDYVPIDRTETWFENTNDIDPETAYFFGLIVGDGGYSVKNRIQFTTIDDPLSEFVSKASIKLWGKPFKQARTESHHFYLYSKRARDDLFEKYGFVGHKAGDKDFPKCILSASRESVAAFIRGLADSDGSISKGYLCVEFTSKSRSLMESLQFILLRFGIISHLHINYREKYDTNYYYLQISGNSARLFGERIGFGLKRKQDILESHLHKYQRPKKEIIPQSLVLDDLLVLVSLCKKYCLENSCEYDRKLFEVYEIKKRDITYIKLERILKCSRLLSDCPQWQRLHKILSSNLFYDKVVSVEDGENTTYDVHMKNEDDRSFISNGIISHNSTLLAVYAILRAIFLQGRKIVITGSGFRQAKTVFSYAENLWFNSPMLQNLFHDCARQGPSHEPDKWVLRLGESTITALPMGTGEKVRGERAHDLIADEFASIDPEIFETVFSGFAVVSHNPVQRAREKAKIRLLKKLEMWGDDQEQSHKMLDIPNQTLISGTAYYTFNHFYEYWKRWKTIIETMGDKKKLSDALGKTYDERLNWRDYAIIRVPARLLPEGYYDEKQITKAKATVNEGIYMNEFEAVFASDSNGFFPRSLIEKCVTRFPIEINGVPVQFRATLRGNPGSKYFMGVDPAAVADNFSIVIIEAFDDHRRVVYCWTTNKEKFKEQQNENMVKEKDYYGYCAKKIRQLAKLFPCEVISLDSQGGGYQILEALQDPDKMEPGEVPIWPIASTHTLSDGKQRDTDAMHGKHIVELVNFAKAEYTSDANHGLKKDLEDKHLLFPMYDGVMLALAFEEDQAVGRKFDTLEDCAQEIEDLKDELSTIKISQTPGTNRDHWDTPETKIAGGKKGRMRKDRYSSLIMANSAARRMQRKLEFPKMEAYGGFAVESYKYNQKNLSMYNVAPEWFTKENKEQNYDYYGMV